jgi:hypothetical protein
LVEGDIKILARKKDLNQVKKAADKAAKEYKDNAGLDVKFSVEDELPEDRQVSASRVGSTNKGLTLLWR